MTILHQQQPPNKKTCGQTCVSMITRWSVGLIQEITGKRGPTQTKDLVKALRNFGWDCDNRLCRLPRDYFFFADKIDYSLSILKVRRKNKPNGSWHWVVIEGKHIYDPNLSKPMPVQDYLHLLDYDKREISSQLRVYEL